jgi:hypothetical protein
MCTEFITTHSCGHEKTDTIPCDAKLDDPDHECPPTEPITDTGPQVCDTCRANQADMDEEEQLAEALRKIETDASLAPVNGSGKSQLVQAKSREYYPHCGHYARVILLDFEIDPNDGEYLDEEIRGSCPGCSIANPKTMEKMKLDGKWGPDPWGELSKPPMTHEQVLAEGGGIGPSKGQQNYGFSSAGGYVAPDIFGAAGASSSSTRPLVSGGSGSARVANTTPTLSAGRIGTQEIEDHAHHGKGKSPAYESDPEDDSYGPVSTGGKQSKAEDVHESEEDEPYKHDDNRSVHSEYSQYSDEEDHGHHSGDELGEYKHFMLGIERRP